jgi:Glycosyl hydrolases family 25
MALLNSVIDLSHHNTVTSFQQIKGNGIIGVIHKATQSTQFVDAEYADRRRDALSAGLLFGSYHFASVRSFCQLPLPFARMRRVWHFAAAMTALAVVRACLCDGSGCSRKNRTISPVASGPSGRV